MPGVLDSFRLDGRVAIVTGASRGLGSAMALGLAEAGADVVLVARGDTSALEREISSLGRRAMAVAVDIAAPEAPARVIEATYQTFGRADILVNNAGIIRRAAFLEFPEQDWRDVLDVNLSAAFRFSQLFARRLVEAGEGPR